MITRAIILAAEDCFALAVDPARKANVAEDTLLLKRRIESVAAVDPHPLVAVPAGQPVDQAFLEAMGGTLFLVDHWAGTGQAVASAFSQLGGAECILVARAGSAPLTAESARALVDCIAERNQDAAILVAVTDQPNGYGRVVRDKYGDIKKIVSAAEPAALGLASREIDVGAYCFHHCLLAFALERLDNRNDRNEYRLEDAVAIIANQGGKVADVVCSIDM